MLGTEVPLGVVYVAIRRRSGRWLAKGGCVGGLFRGPFRLRMLVQAVEGRMVLHGRISVASEGDGRPRGTAGRVGRAVCGWSAPPSSRSPGRGAARPARHPRHAPPWVAASCGAVVSVQRTRRGGSGAAGNRAPGSFEYRRWCTDAARCDPSAGGSTAFFEPFQGGEADSQLLCCLGNAHTPLLFRGFSVLSGSFAAIPGHGPPAVEDALREGARDTRGLGLGGCRA